jgi:hypothetical protein
MKIGQIPTKGCRAIIITRRRRRRTINRAIEELEVK